MSQMVMGSKTPVSILQEMCVRKGCPPHYDLIFDGGGTHEALFKYRVEAAGVSAIGTGRSKKEAKHDAARSALERLAKNETESPELVLPEDALDVASPYRDKIQENAVGALQDLCATNECPQPEYELLAEEGPPHSRIFTFLCSVSKHKEIAVGRTKKQAKQLAASKMYGRLKALPNIVECPSLEKKTADDGERSESTKETVAKYLEITGATKHHVPMGQRLSDYHLSLTSLSEEDIDSILVQHASNNGSSIAVQDIGSGNGLDEKNNDYSLFEQLMSKLNIDFEFEEFETLKYGEKQTVLLQLHTSPISVLYGIGKSLEDAKQAGATNALNYLDVMCRKKP